MSRPDRTVGQLTLSKILERFVANQLISYLDANEMFPSYQSGFRRNNSTETLLLRLLSDFYSAMDRGHVTLLALFDVSSAFDSGDHSVLIQRITTSFGLVDQPLAWLKSFLSDRSSCVVIGPSRSSWVPAPFGVPQGSVLGPLLNLLYTADIGPLLIQLGLLHHLFADDVQAYVHTDPLAAETVLTQMSQAIDVLIRGLRVYPYPRIYPFSIRGYGSGTDRVHFSRVGSGTGMVVVGTGVPGFYPYKPHILSLQCHQYI